MGLSLQAVGLQNPSIHHAISGNRLVEAFLNSVQSTYNLDSNLTAY